MPKINRRHQPWCLSLERVFGAHACDCRPPKVEWVHIDRPPPAPGRYLVTEAFDVHCEGVATRAVNVMYWDGKAWLSGGYRTIVGWAVAPQPLGE